MTNLSFADCLAMVSKIPILKRDDRRLRNYEAMTTAYCLRKEADMLVHVIEDLRAAKRRFYLVESKTRPHWPEVFVKTNAVTH